MEIHLKPLDELLASKASDRGTERYVNPGTNDHKPQRIQRLQGGANRGQTFWLPEEHRAGEQFSQLIKGIRGN